jgi:hypothetical protein
MTLRPALLALALAASAPAWGQAPDRPERILRLGHVEGEIAFQPAGESRSYALPDRPLVPGDRLDTGRDGRAELSLGTVAVRLDARTALTVIGLDETTVQVALERGTANVIVRELYEDETFEIATPHATVTLREPGEYRVDVPSEGATDISVRRGVAELATAGGPISLFDGQRALLTHPDAYASLAAPRPADAFDDWVLDREVQIADVAPLEGELSEEGYAKLSTYGEWYDEPRYGRVWMPSYAYGGWDPFGYGHWQRVGFGWTWVEPLPWGYHTFGHGRWAYLHHLNRWCWVPVRRHHHTHAVAQDTRPFGRPRDRERKAAVATGGLPRRTEGDGRLVFLGDAVPAKSKPRATPAFRTNRVSGLPSTSGSRSSSKKIATTMRPAPARTQAQPQAKSQSQSKSRSQTTSGGKGVFAARQEP